MSWAVLAADRCGGHDSFHSVIAASGTAASGPPSSVSAHRSKLLHLSCPCPCPRHPACTLNDRPDPIYMSEPDGPVLSRRHLAALDSGPHHGCGRGPRALRRGDAAPRRRVGD